MADTQAKPTDDSGDRGDLAVWLQRYMDSELTSEELSALDHQLRANPSARAQFVSGLMQGAYLKELVAQERSAASLTELLDEDSASSESPSTSTQRAPIIPPLTDAGTDAPQIFGSSQPKSTNMAPIGPLPATPLGPDAGASHPAAAWNWRLLGWASMTLVLAFLIFNLWPGNEGGEAPRKVDPFVSVVAAEPVRQRDCVWLVDGKPADPRKLMTGTTVTLKQGEAELEFAKNVRVTLQGPVEFKPAAPDRIILIDGPATAHVPKEAIGFTVDSPTMRVTDLGTEFGVRSFPDGRAVLHVFQGSVQVELADGSGLKRILRTGQSIGARYERVQGQWVFTFDDTIPVDPAAFLRSVPPSGKK